MDKTEILRRKLAAHQQLNTVVEAKHPTAAPTLTKVVKEHSTADDLVVVDEGTPTPTPTPTPKRGRQSAASTTTESDASE